MKIFMKFMQERNIWKKRISAALACIVVFVTVYAMVLPAITLDWDAADQDDGFGFENEDWGSDDSFGDSASEDETVWPLTLTWPDSLTEGAEASAAEENGPAEEEIPDYTVTAVVYEDSGIPEDAVLTSSEIKKGEKNYDDYYKSALDKVRMEAGEGISVSSARFFDIAFVTEDVEVEPDHLVTITIDCPDETESWEEEDLYVIHFDPEDMEEPGLMNIETLERDGQVLSVTFSSDAFSVYGLVRTCAAESAGDGENTVEYLQHSLLGGDSILLSTLLETTMPDQEELQIGSVTDVTTESGGGEASSAYLDDGNILEVSPEGGDGDYRIEAPASREEDLAGQKSALEVSFEDGSRAEFEITISGTPEVDAGLAVISSADGIYLPEDTEGSAEEVEEKDISPDAAAAAEEGGRDTVSRVFDISLNLTQEEQEAYEGGFLVDLTLPEEVTGRDFHLYHIHDGVKDELAIEKTGIVLDSSGLESVSGIQFVTESFSEFVLQYTVDFEYSVNGRTYRISLPGGGFISFYDLIEILNISRQDVQEDVNEDNEEVDAETDEAAPLMLPDVDVSEETRKFVANVESVDFSSPELVWVGKVEDETTVGGIKESKGLEVEYSAELTEEQIAEINAQTVESGDWALISVQPFDTEESLTVTMKNGDQFVIRVTDARDPLGLDGRTFAIANQRNGNGNWYALQGIKSTSNDNYGHYLSAEQVQHQNKDGSEYVTINGKAEGDAWLFEYDADAEAYRVSCNGLYLSIDPTVTVKNSGNDRALDLVEDRDAAGTLIKITRDDDGNYYFANNRESDNVYLWDYGNGKYWLDKPATDNNAKMRLCLPEDPNGSHKATLISAADTQSGQKIVVYQRVLDPETDTFTYYAVDGNGNMQKVYNSSDSVYWKGDLSIEWTLTDLGNSYYTLYNEKTDTYLTPKAETGTDGSYVIHKASDFDDAKHLSIALPGRDDGTYTSLISCWDYDDNATYGLEVTEETVGSVANAGIKPLLESEEFYFAARDPIVHDQLTTVATVDSVSKGIKITMYDWGEVRGLDSHRQNWDGNNPAIQDRLPMMQTVMGADGSYADKYESGMVKPGILADYIDVANGQTSPTVLNEDGSATSHTLGELFSDNYVRTGTTAEKVNHLFLQNVYDETGFYKYSCFENYAYLPGGNDFIVYEQIGTPSNRAVNPNQSWTSTNIIYERGNFMPYNPINASMNYRQNYYDPDLKELPDGDPRKGERLYYIENALPNGQYANYGGTRFNGSSNPEAYANYYLGMKMEAKFSQNPGGYSDNGDPMVFEFNGDDDMWVYLDNVLVLDLGGVHDAFRGRINFRTGEVSCNALNGDNTTIKAMFKKAGKFPDGTDWDDDKEDDYFRGNTFKDFSTHNFMMYYMERGASASDLELMFNLPVLTESQFRVRKELPETKDGNAIQSQYGDAPFYYKAYVYDADAGTTVPCTRAYLTGKGLRMPTYEGDGEVQWLSENPNEEIFLVKPGQTAVFPAIDDAVSWYTVEVSPPDNDTMLNKFFVSNSDPDNSNPTLQAGVLAMERTVQVRNLVSYQNRPDDELVNELQIKKRINGEAYNENDAFELRVFLEKTDGTLGVYRLGEYYQFDKDNRFVYFVGGQRYTCQMEVTDEGKYKYFDFDEPGRTGEEVEDTQRITEHTSANGSLNNFRDGDTIIIKGLLVGTDFYLYERTDFDYMCPDATMIEDKYVFEGTEVMDAYTRDPETNKPANTFLFESLYGEPDPDALGTLLDGYNTTEYERGHAASGAIVEGKDARVLVKNKPYLEIPEGEITVEKKWYDGEDEITSTVTDKQVTYDIYRLVHIHDWQLVVDTAPTDTEPGEQHYECRHDGCDVTLPAETLSPLGHSWGEWIRVTAPTCEGEGLWRRTCQNPGCGETEERTEPALGHNWDTGTVTREPSTTQTGIRHHVCLNDPTHEWDEEIPKLSVPVKYHLRSMYNHGSGVTAGSYTADGEINVGRSNAIRVTYTIKSSHPAEQWAYGNGNTAAQNISYTQKYIDYNYYYDYSVIIPIEEGKELYLYLDPGSNSNRSTFKIEPYDYYEAARMFSVPAVAGLMASARRMTKGSLLSNAPAGPTNNAELNAKLARVGYTETNPETQSVTTHRYYTVAKYDSATGTWIPNGVSTEKLQNGQWSGSYTVPLTDEDGNPYEYYFVETGITPEEEAGKWLSTYTGDTVLTEDGQKTVIENRASGGLRLTKSVTVGGDPVTVETPDTSRNLADGTYSFRIEKLLEEEDEPDTSFTARTVNLTITEGEAAYEDLDDLPAGRYRITEINPNNGTTLSSVEGENLESDKTDTAARSTIVTVEAGMRAESNPVTFTNDQETVQVGVEKTFDPWPESGAYAEVELRRYAPITRGTLSVTLLDQFDAPIAGAEFALYKDGAPEGRTFTTDANGVASVTGLGKGTYKLVQTGTPDAYIMPDPAPESGELKVEDVTTTQSRTEDVLHNEARRPAGIFTLVLTENPNGAPIPGATFTLYKDNEVYTENLQTNAEGKVVQGQLDAGTYYYVQTATTDEFRLPATTRSGEFTVPDTYGAMPSETVTMTNDRKPVGTFILTLIDNHEDSVEGATFTLYKDGAVFTENLQTDSQGRIEVPNLGEGAYYFIETATPVAYKLPANPRTGNFVVPSDAGWTGVGTVEMTNTLKGTGTISLNLTKDDNTTPLEGVQFQLLDFNNQVVAVGTTDENGHLDFGVNLYEGTYTLHQETAYGDLYKAADRPIAIPADGEFHPLTVDLVNEDARVTVELYVGQRYYWGGSTHYNNITRSDSRSNLKRGDTVNVYVTDLNFNNYPGHYADEVYYCTDFNNNQNTGTWQRITSSPYTVTFTVPDSARKNDVYKIAVLSNNNTSSSNVYFLNVSGTNGTSANKVSAAKAAAVRTASAPPAPVKVVTPAPAAKAATGGVMLTAGATTPVVTNEPTPPAGYAVDSEFSELTHTLNDTNGWTWEFPEQIKNNPDGQPYYYYVVETDWGPDGYWLDSYSSNNAHGLSEDGTVTVTNITEKTGALELTKRVAEAPADHANKTFDFIITLTAPEDGTLADSCSVIRTPAAGSATTETKTLNWAVEGETTLTGRKGSFTVSLAKDETISVEDLPVGTLYMIREVDYSDDGYSPSLTSGSLSGTIAEGTTAENSAEVTNTYEPGRLVVEKRLEGNAADSTRPFEFRIRITPENNNNGNGNAGSYTIGETTTNISYNTDTVFSLKGGEEAEFTIKKTGATFSIEEVSADQGGYATSVTSSTGTTVTGKTVSGTISKDAAITVTYTNTRDKTSAEAAKAWQSGGETIDWPEYVQSIEFTLYKTVNGQKTAVTAEDLTANGFDAADFTNPATVGSTTADFKASWPTLPTQYWLAAAEADPENGTEAVEAGWYPAAYSVEETRVTYTDASEKAELTTAAEIEETYHPTAWDADGKTITNHTTISLTIIKVKRNDAGTKLSNAQFQLTRKSSGAYGSFENDAFALNTETNKKTGPFSVGETGEITITDLLPGEYRLTETKAPDGYVITSGDIDFTLNADGTVTVTGRTPDTDGNITYSDSNNMVTFTQQKNGTAAKVTVENEPGAALPNTGGPGTRLFTILGSILILGAGVLLWRRRRLI